MFKQLRRTQLVSAVTKTFVMLIRFKSLHNKLISFIVAILSETIVFNCKNFIENSSYVNHENYNFVNFDIIHKLLNYLVMLQSNLNTVYIIIFQRSNMNKSSHPLDWSFYFRTPIKLISK